MCWIYLHNFTVFKRLIWEMGVVSVNGNATELLLWFVCPWSERVMQPADSPAGGITKSCREMPVSSSTCKVHGRLSKTIHRNWTHQFGRLNPLDWVHHHLDMPRALNRWLWMMEITWRTCSPFQWDRPIVAESSPSNRLLTTPELKAVEKSWKWFN